jgi:Bacteriophage T4, Gp8
MPSATYNDIRIYTAEQLKESVSEPTPNTKIYLTIGKTDGWANDLAPDVAATCEKSRKSIWANMIGGKRIVSSDIEHVIPRFNWTANTVYAAYDDRISDLNDGSIQFYVVTDQYNVYKCLSNNYGANSTSKPTSVSALTTTETADGYIWKYMYTVSTSDILRFTNADYIPVKTLTSDTGELQWSVQNNAISGAIHNVIVLDGGFGYSNANTISLTIDGDGEDFGATATINATAQTVSSIVINNVGQKYTFANVTISGGGGAGAVVRAIISPSGGHGSDPLYELGGKNLIINPKLSFSEEGKLPVINEYRQISLIKDAKKRGTNNVFSNSTFTQTYSLITTGVGEYLDDEWVFQGSTLANASYRGRIVWSDIANNKIYTINNKGIPSADALIGANSFTSRFVSSTSINEIEYNTGRILYYNNIKPIIRSEDQQETFQILIKF